MRIKILKNDMIEKIAAGEVVERPVSAVKELIENSIDSGANTITIEITDGGKSLIRVTDNGTGIEENDLENVFKRHATSKIETLDDLENVLSLGFRGEAMASISAVSQITLTSKTNEQSLGNVLELRGGNITKREKKALAVGTTVIVRNLFFNVPARRKFLKTNAAEASQIESLIEKLALANPHINFTYINDGNTKIKSPSSGLEETIYMVYGKDFRGNLLETSFESDGIKITGFIAKPFVYKNNRSFQNFFINGRYIKSDILTKAVEEAYKTKLPIGKFPAFVLNVTIDPSRIDVNSHPTKTEIRFDDEEEIYEITLKAISESFVSKILVPKVTPKIEPIASKQEVIFKEPVRQPIRKSSSVMMFSEPNSEPSGRLLRKKQEMPGIEKDIRPKVKEIPIEFEPVIDPEIESESPFFSNYKIIGVFLDTYWLIEESKSLYVIDQHAAHERILYDEYKAKGYTATSQKLVTPLALTLNAAETLLLEEKKEMITKMGFDIEEFGTSYAIRAVPSILKNINIKGFLEILNGGELTDIAKKACKAAVKANDKLGISEATELIKKLLKTPDPFTCPHGRPTIIELTKAEIEKMFLRRGA